MKMRNFAINHIVLFSIVVIFSENPWPFSMLTIAQLVYVPFALRLILVKDDWFSSHYYYFAVPAYLAVALLQMTSASNWDGLLAAIYLLFTLTIAYYGLSRFLKRGFTHIEEFSIDMGLMYIAIGGAWFFAHEAGIETGFSPLITWLTGIHFHYSAFLLPIFIGLLGRLFTSTFYKVICSILLISPIIVAIGITFSRWIELFSVLLYIIGLYGLIYLTFKTPFTSNLQKWLVRTSFSALGVTIIFSLLYALGNGFGLTNMSIDFMLVFHGLLNCIGYALLGIIGWALATPPTSNHPPTFPISKIKGKRVIGERVLHDSLHENKSSHRGLVDNMNVYEPQINSNSLSPRIIDFYENTIDYRLFATVKWHMWFKPFAFLYTFVSRKIQQINLPLHNKEVEMTGDIYTLQNGIDGRYHVRAWMRKINNDPVFVALYSEHRSKEQTYMNIALPLPFSSMIGILELHQINNDLQLTSKRLTSCDSHAGIYITTNQKNLFKLPIEEMFTVSETDDGKLIAQHTMWIFSVPFLTINYRIQLGDRYTNNS